MKHNRRLAIVFITGGLVVAGFIILFLQNRSMKTQLQQQKFQIAQQAALIDSMKNNQVNLVANVLDKIDDELKDNPNGVLSDETITRIAAACYAIKPYRYLWGDTLSSNKLSPERGRLLLTLTRMKIDSGSLRKIFSQATFEGADLQEADLKNADLKGANMSGANLHDAKLSNAQLEGANLTYANLWGADLTNADLDHTILKRADLSWAVLNGAELRKADLYEAEVNSAQVRTADLRGAILQWTNLSGAFLNGSNLDSADLFRANLIRANLDRSVLKNTNLTLANLSEANLTEADLTNAVLTDVIVKEQNWLTLLNEWHVKGAEEIQHLYKLVIEGTESSRYQLKKIEASTQ